MELLHDGEMQSMIQQHERLELTAYKDTRGFLTIGYGHLVLPRDGIKSGDTISQARAESLFMDDLRVAVDDYLALFGDVDHSLPRGAKLALVDMAFNLGRSRLAGFQRMIAAVRDRNFARAADEMLNSRWATQVGGRAVELASMMRSC